MAKRAAPPAQHAVRRAALLVGEGFAEQAFLSHLKSLYVQRGTKYITIKTAKGKGGAYVLNFALNQSRYFAFDEVAAMLDTDAAWGDDQRALAAREKVLVFECQPCLEALLLAVAGERVPQGNSARIKRAFEQALGGEAHDPKLYLNKFPKQVLDDACKRLPVLAAVVKFLTD
ncbi:MAG: hypothetical protein CFE46_11615 [Burkholderiales bacterium PBB6]|nr:MAG: hypothetical protein CFE46_11615 [Burkholderiales bacterium PBB6]